MTNPTIAALAGKLTEAEVCEEANVFAAYLLMPDALFSPFIENGLDLLDDRAVEKVARKFRVPVGVVHFRAHLHREDAHHLRTQGGE